MKLTKTVVDRSTPGEKDYFIWDSELKGFGLKVSAGGRKSYVCQYRVGRGRSASSRRITIGQHGSPWTPDMARAEAKALLGKAAIGLDPAEEKQKARKQLSVADLCDQYLADGVATKKASTLATDRGRIERHVKPLLGSKLLGSITRSTVERFMQDVAGGKTATVQKTKKYGKSVVTGGRGTATRTVGLLGGIFAYAVDRGLMEENPARGVRRYRDRKSERFLSQAELRNLGQAMAEYEGYNSSPMGLAVIRLLIFTGARKSEIERLRWSEVDFENCVLRLGDSKTGAKIIRLNGPAIATLSAQPKQSSSDFVFPASRGQGHFVGTPKAWSKIRSMAELKDVRLHDLRHTFASIAATSGVSLNFIAALLGHRDNKTTQRYAHLNEDPLRDTNEVLGNRISKLLESGKGND